MSSQNSENRFNKARNRLSLALENLESVIKEKLHETAAQSKLINASASDLERNQGIVVEQANTIQNLTHEINNLQKNMVEMSKEIEFLNEKSLTIAKRADETRQNSKILVEEVEQNLIRIEQLINDEE